MSSVFFYCDIDVTDRMEEGCTTVVLTDHDINHIHDQLHILIITGKYIFLSYNILIKIHMKCNIFIILLSYCLISHKLLNCVCV